MKKILFVLFTLSMLFFIGCSSKPAVWYTDLEQATMEAEKNNKDLLIFFSGMGWDGYSDKYYNEILSTEEFLKEAGKNYVALNLNIVTDESNLTEEEIITNQTNYMIANSMGVATIPMVFATSADGVPYSYFIYNESSTLETTLDQLLVSGEIGNKIKSLTKQLDKTTGVEKAKIIDELYYTVPTEFSYQFYDLITEFPSLDPENKTGKLGEYKLVLAYEEAMVIFQESGDIQAATQVFLDLAASGILTPEEYQYAYYQAAYIESYGAQILTENTLPYLQIAYDAAPDSYLATGLISEAINTINSLLESEISIGDNQ